MSRKKKPGPWVETLVRVFSEIGRCLQIAWQIIWLLRGRGGMTCV